MRKTIFDGLSQRLDQARAQLEITLFVANLRRLLMNLGFLNGFKTYLIAGAMVLAALGQLLGIEIPSFDGQSAGHLLMEGLALIFLRKSLKAGN
jgi:hypothetical protein